MAHHHGTQETINPSVPDVGDHLHGVFTVAGEHELAIVGLLFLPIAVLLAAHTVQSLSRVVRFLRPLARGIAAAPPATLLAVLLMLATADIHIVLVPSHLNEDPLRAGLFALDGIAFIGVALLAFVAPHWRLAAGVLIVATVLSYIFYVLTGREDVDLVGIVTKVVESAALIAVMIRRDDDHVSATPRRTRGFIACSTQPGGSSA